jgi:D-arabinose 1-dehydrogenase-like Zn-dependent alcohol dehydrogenase
MKALVLDSFGGPLVLRDVPLPEPAEGEVLVRVRACAPDQFDLTIRDGKFPSAKVPIILGHEVAGVVEKTGPGVMNHTPGTRVTSTLYLTCGRCRHCRSGRETICENLIGYLGIHTPGGYAEYTTIPATNLAKIPDDLDFPHASILANAIGTPYHALTKRARLRPGEHVMITGAGGGVGLHAVQLARMMGALVMAVDVGGKKLEAARANGADMVVDPEADDFVEAAMEWTDGRGVDVVLELVGPATMPGSLKAMGKGARMVIVGSHTGTELSIRPQMMISNEWEILGSRNVTKRELQEVVELVAAKRIQPVVTEVHPLEEAEAVHARLRQRGIIGRVALEP